MTSEVARTNDKSHTCPFKQKKTEHSWCDFNFIFFISQRIPEGMKIPGLRDSLVKILQDFNLQVIVNSNPSIFHSIFVIASVRYLGFQKFSRGTLS